MTPCCIHLANLSPPFWLNLGILQLILQKPPLFQRHCTLVLYRQCVSSQSLILTINTKHLMFLLTLRGRGKNIIHCNYTIPVLILWDPPLQLGPSHLENDLEDTGNLNGSVSMSLQSTMTLPIEALDIEHIGTIHPSLISTATVDTDADTAMNRTTLTHLHHLDTSPGTKKLAGPDHHWRRVRYHPSRYWNIDQRDSTRIYSTHNPCYWN